VRRTWVALALGLVFACPQAAAAQHNQLELISIGPTGGSAPGGTCRPSCDLATNDDGSRVAFTTEAALVPGGGAGVYLRDHGTVSWVGPGNYAGATPDLSHIYFDTGARLTPDDTDSETDLYEWSGGVTTLVSTSDQVGGNGPHGVLCFDIDGPCLGLAENHQDITLEIYKNRLTIGLDDLSGYICLVESGDLTFAHWTIHAERGPQEGIYVVAYSSDFNADLPTTVPHNEKHEHKTILVGCGAIEIRPSCVDHMKTVVERVTQDSPWWPHPWLAGINWESAVTVKRSAMFKTLITKDRQAVDADLAGVDEETARRLGF